MNRFLNFLFVISIPFYVYDWYNFLINEDHGTLSCICISLLSLYFAIEIPERCKNMSNGKSFWY